MKVPNSFWFTQATCFQNRSAISTTLVRKGLCWLFWINKNLWHEKMPHIPQKIYFLDVETGHELWSGGERVACKCYDEYSNCGRKIAKVVTLSDIVHKSHTPIARTPIWNHVLRFWLNFTAALCFQQLHTLFGSERAYSKVVGLRWYGKMKVAPFWLKNHMAKAVHPGGALKAHISMSSEKFFRSTPAHSTLELLETLPVSSKSKLYYSKTLVKMLLSVIVSFVENSFFKQKAQDSL